MSCVCAWKFKFKATLLCMLVIFLSVIETLHFIAMVIPVSSHNLKIIAENCSVCHLSKDILA